MDAYGLDWLNLLLRWAHVITAIAWVGSSFYFVFLDASLVPPSDEEARAKGVSGEMWAVHGGGFYHPQKYPTGPRQMPQHLHWFYWESYSTWLTGFALFTVLYLFQAGTFLIDKAVFDWSPGAAVATALGFLVGFWLLYDLACRALGRGPRGDVYVGAVVVVLVAVTAWLACHWFAGRAAFLLTGAAIATAMSANVFFWIIPGQRKVVAQLRAGQPVDPIHGQRGKQRSVHNTYFTLPVLVAMLSNHYGWLVQARHNWLVLLALMLAGALIRHSFVARHSARRLGQPWPWHAAASGVLLLIGLAVALRPAKPVADSAAQPPVVSLQQVQGVINQRCVLCHNAEVQNKNVALHTEALTRQHAQAIYQQAVVLRQMPLNNATQITDEERALIGRWHALGAP
ncbi:urate hydroxylase PuuD [Ideonella sp. DXS29W]|uniref:Urate hydroxylase PuuD n=1 Tax=Ideonella lacteola TaxID=2984193 RepID=A0ABU9BYU3_9BURK